MGCFWLIVDLKTLHLKTLHLKTLKLKTLDLKLWNYDEVSGYKSLIYSSFGVCVSDISRRVTNLFFAVTICCVGNLPPLLKVNCSALGVDEWRL